MAKQTEPTNYQIAGFKRTLLAFIKENGLRVAELHLDFIKKNPGQCHPGFSHRLTIEVYEDAIETFKQRLKNEKP